MKRSDEHAAAGGDPIPHVGPHLTDDQLMESYVLAGENRHLAVCRTCASRFNELSHVLERMRDDAVREADSVFTPERLRDQRDRLMRRLERHVHPADVLMFPIRSLGHPAGGRLFGPARRWIAGAAAAGLAAGVFLGFAVDRQVTFPSSRRVARVVATPTEAALWQRQLDQRRIADIRDEQLLSEIDDLLRGSRAAELRVLDSMTTPPEIQEASFDPRYPR